MAWSSGKTCDLTTPVSLAHIKKRVVTFVQCCRLLACGAASPVCRGPCVLTVHLFVSVHFSSVRLLELVLSKFVAPSPSLPLVSIARQLDVVSIIFILFILRMFFIIIFILIPLIFQCDGAGWLLFTGLPWFCTMPGSLHLWLHHSSRHQPPSSSTDGEFNDNLILVHLRASRQHWRPLDLHCTPWTHPPLQIICEAAG